MTVRRVLLLLLLGCATGLFEATTATFLPLPFRDLRPVLPTIVCFVIFGRTESAYIFAVSAGVALDLFSVGGMTLAFARFLVIALLVGLIAETVLTNHSMYAAVALGVLARAIDWMWLALVHLVAHVAGSAIAIFPRWQDALRTLGLDAAIVVGVFLLNHLVLKRFVAFRAVRH